MQNLSIEEIHKRSRKGSLLLIARRIYSTLITLVSTVTIARLLTPKDYGVAALAIVVVSLMQLFRDVGLTNAILRRPDVSQEEVTFVFWLNLAATALAAAVLGFGAPLIADFFHEPLVADVLRIALIGFVVEGATLQHAALLKRDLRFSVIATIEVAGVTAGFVVGLCLALYLRNYWALVAMGIAQSLVISAMTLVSSKWVPGRLKVPSSSRDLFLFSVNSSIFSVLSFFSRNTATFAIGHMMDAGSVGLFNRAFALFQLPLNNLLQPISQATLPVMARLRAHPEHYARTYCALVEALSCLLLPTGAILWVAGTPLVVTLLGQQWSESGQLLSALAMPLAVYGLVWPITELLVTQNRPVELRTSGFVDFILRAGGTLAGVQFGLLGAVLGFGIGTIATVPFRVWQSGRKGPVTAAAQYRAFVVALPLGIGALACSWAALAAVHRAGMDAHMQAAASLAAGGIGALLAGAAIGATRRAMVNVALMLAGRKALGSQAEPVPTPEERP